MGGWTLLCDGQVFRVPRRGGQGGISPRAARAPRKGRGVFIAVLGAFIAVVDGYVVILSETGFVLLLHGLFLTFIAGAAARKRIPLNQYPILLAIVIATVLVVIFNVYWIAIHERAPFYPFYSASLE